MQKRDFETYQKRFWDFEILPEFSETHVFRGTIRHPFFVVMADKKWNHYLFTDKHIFFKLTAVHQ